MTATSRPFMGEPDIMCINQFLLDTYQITQWLYNWEPRRWLGNIHHRPLDEMHAYIQDVLPKQVHIWEQDGQIIGVVHPEDAGSVFLEIHPHHREIEPEMLAWAEANLTTPSGELTIWCYEDDAVRQSVLAAAGYVRGTYHDNLRQCDVQAIDIPAYPLPEGFTVRTMTTDQQDLEQFAVMLNKAFNRNSHTAAEYVSFQASAIYDADLDIVVTNPAGEIVCTAGFTHTIFGLVEPVCTVPAYEGMGLAKAAIAEGLRRLQARGVAVAFIGASGTNPVSNHVYEKLGFVNFKRHYAWHRG